MAKPKIVQLPVGDSTEAHLYYGVDATAGMANIPDGSVHCCITSPPYWGLRDYGVSGQLGLEKSPEEYIEKLVAIFKEVWRVLRSDGTLWVNIGDCYARTGGDRIDGKGGGRHWDGREKNFDNAANRYAKDIGLKPKDLVGIPWMLAFALRDAGWYLRQEVIWHKSNPMPEQTKDRCTKAHEQIFLFAKSQSYFFDDEAIKEKSKTGNALRSKRSVWTVSVKAYKGAHFATFPVDLIEPCILAGTSAKGCCSVCGAPHERIIGSELDDLEPVDPIQRRGVLLTPQDSAIVQLAERGRCEYRISVTGDKHHNLWEDQPIKGGRTAHFKEKGYSLIWWGDEKKTLRWNPSCQCAGDVAPCVVLDPFSGSATTGRVALVHKRRYIGIDINDEYLPIAVARIEDQGTVKDGAEQDDVGGIFDLFGDDEDDE